MINTLLRRLHALGLRLHRRSRYSSVRRVGSMGDVPDRLGSAIYVVGSDATPKWAVLACPCRCGSRIEVNLMRTRQPHWQLKLHSGTVTLRPSLWRAGSTCGSHFFIERNRVRWV